MADDEYNRDSRFDFDLKFGQNVECWVKKALEGTIEVKAERGVWATSGNIIIEYADRGKPSGIAVTEADHWVQALTKDGQPYAYLVFPVEVMKSIARKNLHRKTPCGDDKLATGVLIKLSELFKV